MNLKLNKRAALWSLVALICFSNFGCSDIEDELTSLLATTLGESGNLLRVIGSTPIPGSTFVSRDDDITIYFNKDFDSQKCTGAFSISPSTVGNFTTQSTILTFNPSGQLNDGTYRVELSKSCEDMESRDLDEAYIMTFSVGDDLPIVQAIGLESQNCSTGFPGVGSASGGNHTLGSCWWDNSLPMLSATNYEFRAGDTGAGLPADCADVTTDNVRIIFSTYMDTSQTIDAISLTRTSPPQTTIRMAAWQWSDCRSGSPGGCRVVTISFSENSASCNGAAFGDIGTGGDFNLECSICPPGPVAHFPLYLLEIDTTARTANGGQLQNTFSFGMEGN